MNRPSRMEKSNQANKERPANLRTQIRDKYFNFKIQGENGLGNYENCERSVSPRKLRIFLYVPVKSSYSVWK